MWGGAGRGRRRPAAFGVLGSVTPYREVFRGARVTRLGRRLRTLIDRAEAEGREVATDELRGLLDGPRREG
jgi:hypothetical protein